MKLLFRILRILVYFILFVTGGFGLAVLIFAARLAARV